MLVVLGVAATLVAQDAEAIVARDGQRVDPGEIEPDLQIAEVAGSKAAQGFDPPRWLFFTT